MVKVCVAFPGISVVKIEDMVVSWDVICSRIGCEYMEPQSASQWIDDKSCRRYYIFMSNGMMEEPINRAATAIVKKCGISTSGIVGGGCFLCLIDSRE